MKDAEETSLNLTSASCQQWMQSWLPLWRIFSNAFLFVMDRVAIKPTGGGDFPSLSAGFGEG